MRHPPTPDQDRSQRLGARLLTVSTTSIGVCNGSLAASLAILAVDSWQTSTAAAVVLVAGLAAGVVAVYTLVRWLDVTAVPAYREAADDDTIPGAELGEVEAATPAATPSLVKVG